MIYLACRQDGYGRTLEEISLVSSIDKASISRVQATIARDLDLRVTRVLPADLVGRISTQARLSASACAQARHVCDMIVKYGLLDALAPQLVAGSALVLVGIAGREEVDLGQVAKGTLSCTVSQLRRGYERLLAHAAFLLSEDAKVVLGDLALLPPNLHRFADGIIPPLPPVKTAAGCVEIRVESTPQHEQGGHTEPKRQKLT